MSNSTSNQAGISSGSASEQKPFKFSFSFPAKESVFAPDIVKQLQKVLNEQNSKDMFLVYSYDESGKHIWPRILEPTPAGGTSVVFDRENAVDYNHDATFPERQYARVCFQEHSSTWHNEVKKFIEKKKNGKADEINYYFTMSGGEYALDSKILRWGISFQMYIEMFQAYCESCHKDRGKVFFIESSSGKLDENSQKYIFNLVQKKNWVYWTHKYPTAGDKCADIKVFNGWEEKTGGEPFAIPQDNDALFIVYGHGEGYEECLKDCLNKENTVLTNVNVFDITKDLPNLQKLIVLAPNNSDTGDFFVTCARELFDFLCRACGKGEKDTKEYFNNVIRSATIVKSNNYDYFFWREDGESIFPFYVYKHCDKNVWSKTPLEIYCANQYGEEEFFYFRKGEQARQRTKEFYGEILSSIQTQFLEFAFHDLDVENAYTLTDLLRELVRKETVRKRLDRIEDILNENFDAETTLCWFYSDNQFVFSPPVTSIATPLRNEMKMLRQLAVNFDAVACQINYCDHDLEDNNVLRFYAAYETVGGQDPFDIRPLIKTELTELSRKEPSYIVLAQSEGIARWLCSNPNYYESKAKEKDSRTIEYVPLFSGCIIKDKNSIQQVLKDLNEYFFKSKEHHRFCYFISGEKKTNVSGIARHFSNGILMYTKYKLSLYEVQFLSETATSLFSFVNNELNDLLRNYANCKSAIGSIMSRNGSHNIGSHVLAALSHNVGTMPDDRVLYQYIQHRMDYIATATTDFPTWYQPTMFVGEIMRNFFMQRHLLDHIAESEGKHAYYFQGYNTNDNSAGTIRLSVCRHIPEAFDKDGVLHSAQMQPRYFVKYDSNGAVPMNQRVFDDDVCLAIPAGVVGNHAFYTIIENILRNAAKHDGAEENSNLEIVIDFRDDKTKEYVEFFVWSKSFHGPLESVRERVNDIAGRLAAPFIGMDGQLRREDWGLAEMKISAGILQRRSISEIGGLPNGGDGSGNSKEDIKEIISPILVEGENGAYHFGYRFHVSKPKEMLFVFTDEMRDVLKRVPPNAIRALKRRGIYIADGFRRGDKGVHYELIDVSNEDKFIRRATNAFDFSFVVLPNSAIDDSSIKQDGFPFRLLAWKKTAETAASTPSSRIWRNDNDRNAMIPEMMDDQEEVLKIIGSESTQNEKVESIVYRRWLEYLESKTRPSNQLGERRALKVLINADGDESKASSGRSLISDIDVWKFVFTHLYKSTLRTFCAQNDEVARKKAPTFLALYFSHFDIDKAGFSQRDGSAQINNLNAIKNLLREAIPKCIQDKVRARIATGYLFKEILNNLKPCIKNMSFVVEKLKIIDINEDFDAVRILSKFNPGTCELEEVTRELKAKYANFKNDDDLPFKDGFDSVVSFFKPLPSGSKLEIPSLGINPMGKGASGIDVVDALAQAFLGAYHAADVMLRKYSENIATLPLIYSANGSDAGDGQIPNIGVDLCLNAKVTDVPILYYRHGADKPRSIYNEGLSGSQSSMMQIQSFIRNPDAGFLCRLTENALMRILIVDERFYKFLINRKEIARKMSWMNVWAVDTDALLDSCDNGEPSKVNADHESEAPIKLSRKNLRDGMLPSGMFDVIIIHQGIIDKILGSDTPDGVKELLEKLKKNIAYVVVTTGRGMPANIPSSARVLPFSSIERHLFQEYPEKVLLVNAIMNLLPCGRR